jgi:hypothetical protein
MKANLRVPSKTPFNHDVGTMGRGRVVVRFTRNTYGDIVGRVDLIKIISPSRKRKVLSKQSDRRQDVARRVQLKWNVTHNPMSPGNGEYSKAPMSIFAPTTDPSKVEVV